jgi:LPS-assembly lipoprotein
VQAGNSKHQRILPRRLFWLWVVVGSLIVGACGFHLRGTETGMVHLPPTYLTGSAGPLQQEVRHYLTISNVSLVNDQKDAKLVIDLISEAVQRRVLSVGSTGKVEEYEVRYTASYAVERGKGESMIPKESLSEQRSYSFNEADVLAKDVEQERLVQDMRRDVVRRMMLRLQSALKPAP